MGFVHSSGFDAPADGGNDDGVLDTNDEVFGRLRLWRDLNHNGVSEQEELFTLGALDVGRIDLAYKEKRRVDEHGNTFLYRARLWDSTGKQNEWAWDVFLTAGH